MPKDSNRSVLPYEWSIYDLLGEHQGICHIHWTGMYGGAHVMVMDKLGPNLDFLRRVCRGSFSLKTVLMLAEQLVSISVDRGHPNNIPQKIIA